MESKIQFTESKPQEGIFALAEVKELFALWREESGLGAEEFGELIEFSKVMVLDTESGRRKMGVLTLDRIAKQLGYNVTFRVEKAQ